MESKKRKKINLTPANVLTAACIVLLLIIAATGFYIVDGTEQAVVTRRGRRRPGTHRPQRGLPGQRRPLFQNYAIYPTMTVRQNVEFFFDPFWSMVMSVL